VVGGGVWARTAGSREVWGMGAFIGGWWFGMDRKIEKGRGGSSRWLVVVHCGARTILILTLLLPAKSRPVPSSPMQRLRMQHATKARRRCGWVGTHRWLVPWEGTAGIGDGAGGHSSVVGGLGRDGRNRRWGGGGKSRWLVVGSGWTCERIKEGLAD
jgi:hypothetical protein